MCSRCSGNAPRAQPQIRMQIEGFETVQQKERSLLASPEQSRLATVNAEPTVAADTLAPAKTSNVLEERSSWRFMLLAAIGVALLLLLAGWLFASARSKPVGSTVADVRTQPAQRVQTIAPETIGDVAEEQSTSDAPEFFVGQPQNIQVE